MTVQHELIPDGKIHEPRGITVAPNLSVYTSNGGGTGNWLVPDTVPEAPNDGYAYVRRNIAWSVAPSDPQVLHFTTDLNNITPPPGNQKIKWNNASQVTATELYVSTVDESGRDVNASLGSFVVGDTMALVDSLDLGHYQNWTVNTITDNSSYFTFGVTIGTAAGSDFPHASTVSMHREPAVVAAMGGITLAGSEGKAIVVNNTGDGFDLEPKSNYGASTYYAEDLGIAFNATMAFDDKLTYIANFDTATYDVTISTQIGTGASNKDCEVELLIDGMVTFNVSLEGITSTTVNLTKRIAMSGSQTCIVRYRSTSSPTSTFILDTVLRFVSV